MEETSNIIETMISQHRTLQKDLGGVLKISSSENIDFDKIISFLNQFQIDLNDHLALENGIFYPELLARMKKNNMNLNKTQDFIDEMKTIGDVIVSFLNKYNEASVIEILFENFKKELNEIIFTLNLRIESEESGVYLYWALYK